MSLAEVENKQLTLQVVDVDMLSKNDTIGEVCPFTLLYFFLNPYILSGKNFPAESGFVKNIHKSINASKHKAW